MVADERGYRAVAAAQADLCQRSIERWIELLYERTGGTWFNVRVADGMVLLAPPWSRTRRTAYHLTEPQARLLRIVVGEVLDALPHHRRLFWYDADLQRWFLHLARFPELDDALTWQQNLGHITPGMWRRAQLANPGGRRAVR